MHSTFKLCTWWAELAGNRHEKEEGLNIYVMVLFFLGAHPPPDRKIGGTYAKRVVLQVA